MKLEEAIEKSEFKEAYRRDDRFTYYINENYICYSVNRNTGASNQYVSGDKFLGYTDWEPLKIPANMKG